MIPKGSEKTDWEVELAIVIGKTALYVPENEALSYVAGYCICNDISERAFQTERGGQWMKGKGSPTFGPLGPWLVTPDEFKDIQNVGMWLELNGKRVQDGSTKTMIFGVAHVVSYISQFLQLDPGDVITTGTPPGVGLGMKPPVFLKAGDTHEGRHRGHGRAEPGREGLARLSPQAPALGRSWPTPAAPTLPSPAPRERVPVVTAPAQLSPAQRGRCRRSRRGALRTSRPCRLNPAPASAAGSARPRRTRPCRGCPAGPRARPASAPRCRRPQLQPVRLVERLRLQLAALHRRIARRHDRARTRDPA